VKIFLILVCWKQVTSYVHGASELLGVQIDAAINAGTFLSMKTGIVHPMLVVHPKLFGIHTVMCLCRVTLLVVICFVFSNDPSGRWCRSCR
jgi:hypothetical protein